MQFFNRIRRISISKKQVIRMITAGVLVAALVTSSNVALAEKSVSQMTKEKQQLQNEISSLD